MNAGRARPRRWDRNNAAADGRAAARRGRTARPAWIGTLYTAGAIAYLLWGAPGVARWPWYVHGLVAILALACPFFVWPLARSIFEDDFQVRGTLLIPAAIVIAGIAQSVFAGILGPASVSGSAIARS
jgi:hypothetical protein